MELYCAAAALSPQRYKALVLYIFFWEVRHARTKLIILGFSTSPLKD